VGVAEPVPTDAAGSTTGASVLGGGVWQLASRILPQITTLVLSVAAARILGPEDFGRQSFIAFVAIATTMFFSGGLKVAVMRYFAELLGSGRAASARGLVRWAWGIQAAVAVLGGLILAAVGALGAEPEAAWLLAGLATLLGIAQTTPTASLLGAQRFRETATIGLVTDSAALPITVGVLLAGGGIVGIFAVQAAIAAVNLGWTTVVAHHELEKVSSEWTATREWRDDLVRFALFSTAGTVLTLIIWRRSEFFFLDAYSNDVQIGLYSIAFAATTALVLVPQTLGGVVAPAFATLFGAGDEVRMRSGYGRAVRLLGLLTLPLTAIAFALGPGFIELVYGEDYSDVGPILLIMLALVPLLPIYNVSASLLVGLGRARAPLSFGAIAGLVTIGFDFLLIPRWDAVGAAVANNLGQLVVIALTSTYTLRLVGGVPLHPASIIATLTTSVLAGALAWLVYTALGGALGLLVGLVTAIAIMGLLAVRFGLLDSDDADWLERTTGDRYGGAVARISRAIARR
jgi:O-antigen/teichoic acid export membrane protein